MNDSVCVVVSIVVAVVVIVVVVVVVYNAGLCSSISISCCHITMQVRPQYQVCRDSASECDVPEFCDGISGQVSIL